LRRSAISHVERAGFDCGTRRAEIARDGVEPVRAARAQHELRARYSQRACNALADSTRCARDENDFVHDTSLFR
jgi:hypothetical protein